MTGYDVVLALHVLTAVAALLLAGLVHGAEHLSARAQTVDELRRTTAPLKLGPAFGALTALLLVLGMALLGMSDERYGFGDPFIWTALVVVAYLLLVGPLVLGPHETKVRSAVAEAPDGPVPADLQALLASPRAWRLSWVSTLSASAVILNMILKLDTLGCVLLVLVGALLGALVGQRGSTRAAVTA